jgi:septal ring factor EnvC (AmiA/AmiB activator)
MSSKKKRQTLDKLRREQAVRKRREDKAQRKADARAAKSGETTETVPSDDAAIAPDAPEGATVEPTKNGSGLRDAPSLPVQ